VLDLTILLVVWAMTCTYYLFSLGLLNLPTDYEGSSPP
jgi:hypothetical protein